VIVTYQSRDLIAACLESIARQGLPVETIVVDNASTDGTLEHLASAIPQPSALSMPANRGFAAAVNAGAERARGTFLLLLNPDAELMPGALATLTTYLGEHSRVAAVGPRLVFPDGTPQDAAFRYPTLLMTWFEFFPHPARLLHTRWNGRLDAQDGGAVEIDHPLGACMLIRRAAWDDVGPLDEGFFMYCEEVDWCMRAKQRGWSIRQAPAATVLHHSGASAAKSPESLLHLYASRRRLHRKYRGRPFRLLAGLITRIGLLQERHRLRKLQRSPGKDSSAAGRLAAIEQVLKSSLA
jgi:GT2 family glycosyltransferase